VESDFGAIPPASRNQRKPTGPETPARHAARSLGQPCATAAQNSWRFSRRESGGRPGDHSGFRPDRFERRFLWLIATPLKLVLRQPIESAQYCSDAYLKLLKDHGFTASMSGKGNCYDNAMVEAVFKTIKAELIWRAIWRTRDQAKAAIARYIDGFYNPIRRHSALGYKSPIQFESHALKHAA
jgi:putative transposase